MKGKNAIITVMVFLVLVGAFTGMSLLKPDKSFSAQERRYLAQRPEFSLKELFSGEFAKKYEEYITDQFVFRDEFIGVKTTTERYTGKKDINGVYLAAQDYLIEVHSDEEIDEEKSANNADRLVAFVENMSSKEEIENVSVMIVPTAVITLENMLPKYATTWDQNAFIDGIKARIGSRFIDVRPVLNAHKEEYIYYKTDHHWTTLAAYYAYEHWCKIQGIEALAKEDFTIRRVCEEFYGTVFAKLNYAKSADVIESFEAPEDYQYQVIYNMGAETTDTLYDAAALETNDPYSYFLKGNNPIVEIDSNVKNGKTLLVIKDSYAHCFVPFLANHYEKIVMIDLRHLKRPVSLIVEQYKVTDILVLYNTIHFAQDTNMSLLK